MSIMSHEVTGSVTRIEVDVTDEAEAIELAQEALGHSIAPAWTAEFSRGWEIVFENGDYL